MSKLTDLAREAVRRLTPYASARSLVAAADAAVFLDANESPVAPLAGLPGRNRYPAPQPAEVLERLARLYRVRPNNLLLGRGADDAIDALVRTFCEANRDAIMICPPTYGVYAVAAQIQGAEIVEVPLLAQQGFALDVDGVREAWRAPMKLVFLCSPNNPTGNLLSRQAVLRLCAALDERALVVVDEAYVEFASQGTLAPELARFPNLVLLRTLSKAWALAGARCGVAVAAPEIIELLQRVRAPYPVSTSAMDDVLAVLRHEQSFALEQRVRTIVAERQRLALGLAAVPDVIEVFPSEANFLLVRMRDAAAAERRCLAAGIVIRNRSSALGLHNCVRVSVGTAEENHALVRALGDRR